MRPHQFATIAIRVLALFLVYRGLEFGISQMIQGQLAIGMMEHTGTSGQDQTDTRIGEMIASLRIMTGIGAVVPIFLAGVLWFMAPVLARRVAGPEEGLRPVTDELPLQASLIQVAAIIMFAMAASTLPKMIYDFQWQHRRDPSITLMTSKVFPDVIQFLSKIFVGWIMLIVVKRKFARRPSQ